MSRALVFVAGLLLASGATAASAAPIVSLWYRGQPAGVPREADVRAIAAAGFAGITWPTGQAAGLGELRRLVESYGLVLTIRQDAVPLTAAMAQKPPSIVDVVVGAVRPGELAPTVWRAIAHGATVISFDAGLPQGTGLPDVQGRRPAWLDVAIDVAQQMSRNARLFNALRAGPAVKIEPAVDGLDVALVDAGRSWLLIATHASPQKAETFAMLPAGVPPAEWLNLFDGSTISMLSLPAGPRWRVNLGPGEVRVYLIDKNFKEHLP